MIDRVALSNFLDEIADAHEPLRFKRSDPGKFWQRQAARKIRADLRRKARRLAAELLTEEGIELSKAGRP